MAAPDRDPIPERGLLDDADIGAVVTVLLSFVPLSPILGGAVTGYLHGEHGGLAGAVSGLFAVIPQLLFALAALGSLSVDLSLGTVVGVIWIYELSFGHIVGGVALYGIVLGAFGGVVGGDAAAG